MQHGTKYTERVILQSGKLPVSERLGTGPVPQVMTGQLGDRVSETIMPFLETWQDVDVHVFIHSPSRTRQPPWLGSAWVSVGQPGSA